MTCDHLTDEDLVAWLDGETDAATGARVAAHVAGCAVCAREAALLSESGELLVRFAPAAPAPSAGFEARVLAAAKPGPVTAPRGRLYFLRPRAAVAAAALVGAAVGVWWFSSPRGEDELTAREEEALAEDLAVITNLDALQSAESTEIAQLADDLDAIEAMGPEEEDG